MTGQATVDSASCGWRAPADVRLDLPPGATPADRARHWRNGQTSRRQAPVP